MTHYKWYDYKHAHTTYRKQLTNNTKQTDKTKRRKRKEKKRRKKRKRKKEKKKRNTNKKKRKQNKFTYPAKEDFERMKRPGVFQSINPEGGPASIS